VNAGALTLLPTLGGVPATPCGRRLVIISGIRVAPAPTFAELS